MTKFFKGQKFPFRKKPYQKTREFIERLKKQGFQKGNKVNLGRKIKPTQGFQKEEKHWNFKGKDYKYSGVHSWIVRKLGKPQKCEHCGTISAKMYDWANVDHEYKVDLRDWIRLCRGCHMKYDIKNGLRTYK